MSKYIIQGQTLTDIANAIRNKTNKTNSIAVADMATEIGQIETSGNMQSKTVTPTTSQQTITPDSNYDGLSSVTVNAMPTATQATPSITVSSSGLITAKSTQTAGYVASGTKQATKQLTTQAAKTITPSTSSQTAVASGVYTTGAVTVAAIPSNYEDVGTETTAYTNLNSELEAVINSLPNAGGDPVGGSIGTCTVTINVSEGNISCVIVTQCIDGEIFSSFQYTFGQGTVVTIENVVCGSNLSFYWSHRTQTPGLSVSDGVETLFYTDQLYWFSIPTAANANVTISVQDAG